MTWVVGSAAATLLGLWLLIEILVRLYVEWPLRTDFYGSIPRREVRQRQERYGVRIAIGIGWAHLGWIADPEGEGYRVERETGGGWQMVARPRFGSQLVRDAGRYRVWAEPLGGGPPRLLGEANVEPRRGASPVYLPRIAGSWRPIFRPAAAGDYVNDHCIFQDAHGEWRLTGITAKGRGNYAKEKHFAVGISRDFPLQSLMQEAPPVADFGELAWAPYVIADGGTYHLFWSPHRLHRMSSPDGIDWQDRHVVMEAPFHKFFRDASVIRVAEDQWLLYATARGAYFSRIDVYQSFDLEGWQYIGTALRGAWGSERNAIVSSMESPTVVTHHDRFYLWLTYNNDSFFWPALLLPFRVWLDPPSYNDTLVFHADNPYEFGTYRGRDRSPSLLTRLEAHAAEIVHDEARDAWYITTAGWPWVATLTSGEVAAAPLRWEDVPGPRNG